MAAPPTGSSGSDPRRDSPYDGSGGDEQDPKAPVAAPLDRRLDRWRYRTLSDDAQGEPVSPAAGRPSRGRYVPAARSSLDQRREPRGGLAAIEVGGNRVGFRPLATAIVRAASARGASAPRASDRQRTPSSPAACSLAPLVDAFVPVDLNTSGPVERPARSCVQAPGAPPRLRRRRTGAHARWHVLPSRSPAPGWAHPAAWGMHRATATPRRAVSDSRRIEL
jgi:hypothetical protein